VAMGPVAQVLGELAEHFGWPAEAAAHYQQAAAVAERARAPRWTAEAPRLPLDRLGTEQPLSRSVIVPVQCRAARYRGPAVRQVEMITK
jgi:hypothetical protein